jgi:hypothetical protein
LKRKKKYYSMVKYHRKHVATKTLQQSIDKHMLKVWKYDKRKKLDAEVYDIVPLYSGTGRGSNDDKVQFLKETVNKKKLIT